MAAKRKRAGIEWVGGLVSLPSYVTGEGPPYRPEVLLWLSGEGAILGHVLGKPGEVVGMACESLRDRIERPAVGRPHAPARLRVASPELAHALAAGHPGIEVVCAPTPEIDVVAAAMREGYPWLLTVDEGLVARPPTPQDLTIAEAIARALPMVLKGKKALLAAWRGGEPVVRRVLVSTHAGDVEVALRVPYEARPRG